METNKTKVCTACGNKYPATLEFFHRDKRVVSGLKAECKTCSNLRLQQFRSEHPDRIASYTKTYNEKHREFHTLRSKQWREQNPDKKREQVKRFALQYPEKVKAQKAVKYAIQKGVLMPAKNQDCAVHGERCKGMASEYHHHRGYSREHILDVIPVCVFCHRMLDKGGK